MGCRWGTHWQRCTAWTFNHTETADGYLVNAGSWPLSPCPTLPRFPPPQYRVLAFEPVPHFRAFLDFNVHLNNVHHLVEVRPNALSVCTYITIACTVRINSL